MIILRSAREIELIRRSCRLVARTFQIVKEMIRADITTLAIDQEVERFIKSQKGYPAFKGFHDYPANSCISVDDEVVHGIPGKRVLKFGEIVGVDIGVELDGYYGDAARTYAIGYVSPEKKRLMDVTYAALYDGIAQARPGNRLSDISNAIQTTVEAAGFSVVRELVGHGIGQSLHEEPQIPNYGKPHQGPRLKAGMVFAIEPMVNMGKANVITDDDEWTVKTKDGLPSAHFEHTIVITDSEPEILTYDEIV
ncbi:type I methionyl aminopeptidase [candidate division KSB1 bacterium]|nr:type I methionyl aminopeptidase [candidate division KSB1 bacterium]